MNSCEDITEEEYELEADCKRLFNQRIKPTRILK